MVFKYFSGLCTPFPKYNIQYFHFEAKHGEEEEQEEEGEWRGGGWGEGGGGDQNKCAQHKCGCLINTLCQYFNLISIMVRPRSYYYCCHFNG